MIVHVKIEIREDEPSPGLTVVEVSELGEVKRVSMVVGPNMRKELGETPAVVHAAKWCVTSLLEEKLGG